MTSLFPVYPRFQSIIMTWCAAIGRGVESPARFRGWGQKERPNRAKWGRLGIVTFLCYHSLVLNDARNLNSKSSIKRIIFGKFSELGYLF